MKFYHAIAAMAENRVIGAGSRIPWHLPEDFRWFKQATMGHVLLMGRRTFESVGRPLPGRETVVVSRAGFTHSGVRVVADWRAVNPAEEERTVFVAGGAQIYKQTLVHCSDLFLSRVRGRPEGDVLFPMFEDRFELIAVLAEHEGFRVEHHRNRAPLPVAAA